MQDDTRARILQAAETLFANDGFANTSLRAITARAGVNLAAVNYHFGSKEALIQEIFKRRLDALNQERMQRLRQLEQRAAEARTSATVEDILHAYLAPTLKTGGDPGEARFMRLLGRTHLGASKSLREFVQSLYGEVLDRYVIALSRALPHLDRVELYWRLHFLTGTVAYSLSAGDSVALFGDTRDASAADSNERLLQRLLLFIAAGLNAPAPAFDRPLSPNH